MMEPTKLRRADLFSSAVMFLFGVWIVVQALRMPMKGSWGGVQNVWYVSPALFPLFVGAMISVLGLLLMRTAYRSVGRQGLAEAMRWIGSSELIHYLATPPILRFYAMVVLLFSFVFLTIPDIDFFVAAVWFLLAFISMFYLDDDALLRKLLTVYLLEIGVLWAVLGAGVPRALGARIPFAEDWIALGLTVGYGGYLWSLGRHDPTLKKKCWTILVLAVVAPFLIGASFKYLLLVPMPKEGLVVAVLDAVRYGEF